MLSQSPIQGIFLCYNEYIKRKSMQLRPHQEQAIQAMIDNDKGQVIVPTGGGKTICMIQDAKREFESEALVLLWLLLLVFYWQTSCQQSFLSSLLMSK